MEFLLKVIDVVTGVAKEWERLSQKWVRKGLHASQTLKENKIRPLHFVKWSSVQECERISQNLEGKEYLI